MPFRDHKNGLLPDPFPGGEGTPPPTPSALRRPNFELALTPLHGS